MSEFNLEYTCKETGARFLGRGLGLGMVKVRSEDGLQEMNLSKHKLLQMFKPSKKNKGHAFRKKLTGPLQ